MSTRLLNIAIISGLLLATAAPAFAADEPKTKADCDKAKGKWEPTADSAWLIFVPC
jgi:hypothetical protein